MPGENAQAPTADKNPVVYLLKIVFRAKQIRRANYSGFARTIFPTVTSSG